ncbi:MAG: stage III sporulation protein AB [Oscillospiraceae bacterium]|nr:stage III sporulation protein AB [Oscillospiraceae bacterium]
MFYIKLIGLLLLAAVLARVGYEASRALHRRVRALSETARWIVRLASHIRYTATPLDELLRVSAADCPALAFLHDINPGDLPRHFDAAILQHAGGSGFAPPDIALLREFGAGLGTSDVEGQLAHCALFQELFEKQTEAARTIAQNKGRVYTTLGLAGGICLILLLM